MLDRRRVTIVNVADEAGVSSGTVSRVLNGRAGNIKISPATEKKVRRAAEKLGYRPNPFASALRTERTGIIGAITPDISAVFLSKMARALQLKAHQQGIELLIGNAEQDSSVSSRQLEVMSQHWFDGLLLIGDLPNHRSLVKILHTYNKSYVSVAGSLNFPPPMVNIDEEAGVRMAMDCLLELGHKRIAFIGNHDRMSIADRLEGYQHYLAEKQLYSSSDYIEFVPINRLSVMKATKRLLNLPEAPTAVFCGCDLLALKVIQAVQQLEKRVPDDLSVIGFDDTFNASDNYPALTTVRQSVEEMAEKALDLLKILMDGAKLKASEKRVIIRPELIIRESATVPRNIL